MTMMTTPLPPARPATRRDLAPERQVSRIVSIVVPCRNEARHLMPFLTSLLRQETAGFALEILVADGRSTDGTRALLDAASAKYGLRVIDNPEGTVSTGLNRCIRAAAGEVVVRMDVHTEYAPDYVRRSVEVLDQTGADNVGGPALTRARGYLPSAIAAAYHSPFACGGARFHQAGYEGPVDTVTYGCWRRSLFDRIGLFDEDLVRNQDDEFNLRIVRAGGTVWQSPRITSWYWPRTTLRTLFRQYFQYGFWKVAVIRKHRRPASWRHLVPVLAVSSGLALLAAVAGLAAAGYQAASLLALAVLGAGTVLYAAGAVAAAVITARANDWRLLPVLPLVFATYHMSYGAGFLLGLCTWRGGSSGRMPASVTELSR